MENVDRLLWSTIDTPDGSLALYDHEPDPHERKSLAGWPDLAPLLSELSRILDEGPEASKPFERKRP
ncbi:MAG: hypothetical protein KF752_02470 [Pirellulaceae bacterium]|nr:hypothetical protein [Pirellulaceae bacterium]